MFQADPHMTTVNLVQLQVSEVLMISIIKHKKNQLAIMVAKDSKILLLGYGIPEHPGLNIV